MGREPRSREGWIDGKPVSSSWLALRRDGSVPRTHRQPPGPHCPADSRWRGLCPLVLVPAGQGSPEGLIPSDSPSAAGGTRGAELIPRPPLAAPTSLVRPCPEKGKKNLERDGDVAPASSANALGSMPSTENNKQNQKPMFNRMWVQMAPYR